MSYARSPRPDFSMTIGMSVLDAMLCSLVRSGRQGRGRSTGGLWPVGARYRLERRDVQVRDAGGTVRKALLFPLVIREEDPLLHQDDVLRVPNGKSIAAGEHELE